MTKNVDSDWSSCVHSKWRLADSQIEPYRTKLEFDFVDRTFLFKKKKTSRDVNKLSGNKYI